MPNRKFFKLELELVMQTKFSNMKVFGFLNTSRSFESYGDKPKKVVFQGVLVYGCE